MAEFKLGRLRFVWKGNWTATTQYVKDDVIRYGGKVYVALLGHIAQTDFYSDLNDTSPKWSLMADGIVWTGNWATSHYYKIGDIVKKGSNAWICISGHTSNSNGVTGFNSDLTANKWQTFTSSIEYIGDWASSTTYSVGDIVKFGGKNYIAILDHESNSTSPSGFYSDLSANKWQIFSEGVVWKSQWVAATYYKVNDIVKFGANAYICTTGHTSSSNFATDEATKWETFVEGTQFEDTWSSSTQYQKGDIVSYGGYNYIAKKTNTNIVPSTNVQDPLISSLNKTWNLMTTGYNTVGTYIPGNIYHTGDVVNYGGNSYVTIVDNQNDAPTDITKWQLIGYGLKTRGAYVHGTTYLINEVVSYGGILYRSLNSNTNVKPSTDPSSWEVIVTGINPLGSWSSSTGYKTGDIVLYGADLYRALQDSTNQIPSTAGSYWSLLIQGYSFQGTWNISTAYKVGQVVTYGGSTFQAKIDNTGTLPTITSSWDKISYGIKNSGIWATSTTYNIDEMVTWGGNTFISLLAHTSGTFETDLAANKWQKLSSGVRWIGDWAVSQHYLKDDLVKDPLGSVYIATTEHTASSDFNADKTAGKWHVFVLNTGGSLPSAGVEGPGAAITISSDASSLAWIGATASDNVIYVAPHGVDSAGNGSNLATPYASLKYACQHASSGSTILVKTGTYYEQLPIVVPEHTAIVGDNQRTVVIRPAVGLSDDGITPNENSSMFLMSNGSILNKMTFKGMTGWVHGSTAGDVTTSTIAGVVVRFNPASPILTKSPYVLECAAICTGAIGALIDGSIHATGGKTMIFHGFTVISDNGIGYWVKDGGKAEIVSCFTYYCYFGYTASGGGFIRALNGNNSYGTWGATSRGYLTSETPVTGTLFGKQLNFVYTGGNIGVGDTLTTSGGASATVYNVQTNASKVYVSNYSGTFNQGDTIQFSSGGTGVVASGTLEGQKGFILLLNNLSEMPKPGASISLTGDTFSYVIQSVSGTWVNASSVISLVLAQEKPDSSNPGVSATIRYKYSQIRLTGHDFLNIGTGGVSTTNYPNDPNQPAAQGNEIDEAFPGRVFYVSTDQDGNFRVGEYFRIDQATGRATLNASAFDLSGLTSLRLGSIGAQLGETINEFSSDTSLSGDSNMAVPTEHAVKTYVDASHKATFEPTGFNRGIPLTTGIMEFSVDGTTIHKIDHTSTYTSRTDGKFATGTLWETTATANTFVIYPATGQTSYTVWQAGAQYILTTIQSVTVPGLSGTAFFFIDQGTLVSYSTMSGDYIQKQSFCALVYVNSDTGQLVVFGDERHGITMDGATHYYLHTTTGTRFKSGLSASGVSAGITTFTSFTSGEIWDEDIMHTIPSKSTIPMLYRNGTNWSMLSATNTFAYIPSGVAKYNNAISAGNYSISDVPTGYYSVMYIMATNCRINPYVRVMGQYTFSTLAKARESAQTEPRDTSTTGLPVTEFLWVGAVVVDSTGVVQTLDNGAYYVDLRYVNISSGTNSSSAVQGNAADTYFNVSKSGYTSNNVQDALDTTITTLNGVNKKTNSTLTMNSLWTNAW